MKESKKCRLDEETLASVTGGLPGEVNGDADTLRFSGKAVPLPPADSKKPAGSNGEIRMLCTSCGVTQTFEKTVQGYCCPVCGLIV